MRALVAMLDTKGTTLALIMGLILIFIGIEYFVIMISFLALAVIATKYEYFSKKEMGIYEHERGWENVLANGLAPTIFAIASIWVGPFAYLSSVAGILSDKFASELGVLAGDPISLSNFKRVKPGTSGAVSPFGTLMSLGGSTIVGAIAIFLFNITPDQALFIGLAGFAGSVIDTLFGIFEEMGIGTKGTTNFLCSVASGLIGFYFYGGIF